MSLLQACCAWSFCSCWCWRLIFCTLVLTTCRTMAYSSFSRLYFFRRAYSSRPLQAAMRLAHRVAACVDFAVRCCFWLEGYTPNPLLFTPTHLLSNLFPPPAPESALTSHLPIGIGLPNDLIDLGTSVGLLSVNQDQSLTFTVGAGSTASRPDGLYLG